MVWVPHYWSWRRNVNKESPHFRFNPPVRPWQLWKGRLECCQQETSGEKRVETAPGINKDECEYVKDHGAYFFFFFMFGFPNWDHTRSLKQFLNMVFVSFNLWMPTWFETLIEDRMNEDFPHRLSHPTVHVCLSSLNWVVYVDGLLSRISYAFIELFININLLRLLIKGSLQKKKLHILWHLAKR